MTEYLEDIDAMKYNADGLIPAIIQDADNGEVLMLAYMSRQSLRISLKEGRTCFWSRSRQELWRKGDTSGHTQKIRSITTDCDRDTLLIGVDQVGAACHKGTRSCFVEEVVEQGRSDRGARQPR